MSSVCKVFPSSPYLKHLEIIMNKFVMYITNKNFWESFLLTNIVIEETCFKNLIKPTCINLNITYRKEHFIDMTVRDQIIIW